jgi:predicted metalloprotease with PDZ domain
MSIAYEISISRERQHTFEVVLHIAQPLALQELSLPAWIPGSYLIREFTRHLGPLTARQGRKACAIVQRANAAGSTLLRLRP